MSQISHPTGSDLFTQMPVSAIAMNRMLADRYADTPAVTHTKRFLSNMLTLVLLGVSIFGFYEIATLLSPAHHEAVAPVTTAKVAAAPVNPVVPTVASLPRSIPLSLSLPSIDVTNANVVSVGQNSDGTIEVPGPNDVGWYNLGPTPGEIGPAVLVGHVDYVTTGPAIFWNLRNMKPGDTVQVARQDGKTVAFKVEKVQSYGQESFPTQEVYGNISYPGLRLITCTGDFNYVTHHYSDNLVVYARAQL
jgi:sortase (surface protein transpeptidase)